MVVYTFLMFHNSIVVVLIIYARIRSDDSISLVGCHHLLLVGALFRVHTDGIPKVGFIGIHLLLLDSVSCKYCYSNTQNADDEDCSPSSQSDACNGSR